MVSCYGRQQGWTGRDVGNVELLRPNASKNNKLLRQKNIDQNSENLATDVYIRHYFQTARLILDTRVSSDFLVTILML